MYHKNKLQSYKASDTIKVKVARIKIPLSMSTDNRDDVVRVINKNAERVIQTHEQEIKKLAYK